MKPGHPWKDHDCAESKCAEQRPCCGAHVVKAFKDVFWECPYQLQRKWGFDDIPALASVLYPASGGVNYPSAGGWLDQPALLMDAIGVFASEKSKHEPQSR